MKLGLVPNLRPLKFRHALPVVCGAILLGYIVVRIFAAGPAASFLPPDGSISGSAAVQTKTGAIGGHMLVFGVTPTPTPTAAPTPTPTPTSTPTPGCSGPANHVPGGPDGTGTCWPGPNNTGVPAGTVLTAYTGPCTIMTAGTVIDSKIINCGGLGIMAANVTIKNSKVNGPISLDSDRVENTTGNWSLTVQDSEVDGQNSLQSAIANANLTLLRNNIHGAINAAECDPPKISYCNIRDNYIHGQTYLPNAQTHLGGFLSDGGTNLTLIHNTVICDTPVAPDGGGCTGDINLIPNFGTIDGVLIQHNLLGASPDGSYCTYGGEKSSSPYPHAYNVVYKDNIFQRGANNKCAFYGPVTNFEISNTGNIWTNNTWANGGAVAPEN